MSVFVNDVESIDNTIEELNNMGYKTLKISDTLVDIGGTQLIKILKLIVTTILIFVLFFISYFIIKIILKSRNIYFSILRMLGASKRVCRQLLSIELFTISNLSYFIFVLIAI
jgi:cell division protein FtsX